MKRTCENCGETYDDFNHSTICPHQWFPISKAARDHLRRTRPDLVDQYPEDLGDD